LELRKKNDKKGKRNYPCLSSNIQIKLKSCGKMDKGYKLASQLITLLDTEPRWFTFAEVEKSLGISNKTIRKEFDLNLVPGQNATYELVLADEEGGEGGGFLASQFPGPSSFRKF
jgi:hypothetical protein